MNYRHAFHAGNFADVFKHAILAAIIEQLKAKPAPFRILDTHAGIGLYDLQAEHAAKTGEWRSGIGRLLQAQTSHHPALQPYLDAVRSLNEDAGADPLRWYPGSPMVARKLMRPGDKLVLAELHPDDASTLKHQFANDPAVGVHHMDGYLALKAHLPPVERRGLVLVDPPFEVADEFDRLVEGLERAHRRWSTGIKALWYPIKERPSVWRFHDALERLAIPKTLAVELTIHSEDTHKRLNGCGMIIINPPWQLDKLLGEMLPSLHAALGAEAGGTRIDWIVPESPANSP